MRHRRDDPRLDRRTLKWIRIRVRLMAALFVLLFAGVAVRAVDLQVVQRERFAQMAEEQALREVVLTPRRGRIDDRHGEALALSVDVDSVFVEPSRIADRAQVAAVLAEVLDVDEATLLARMERGRHFAWARRRVSPAQAARVRALNLPGAHLTREARRFYPHRETAAHVLGFAGIDGRGLEGLELVLDTPLLGTARSARALRDARGNRLLGAGDVEVAHLGGGRVTLTLDRTIQYHAEKALEAAVDESEAKAGTVVVLDPRTGEILALATRPTFNPNEPGESARESRRNRAITDTYEPGSVFKVFSIAAVLEAGLVDLEERIDCERGRTRIGGHTIRDANPYGELTVAEIMKVSSNIGSSQLASRLGKEGMVEALRRFGFGERTGIEMPGEQRGILRPGRELSDVGLATVSFGQGVSATPLQMATALGAVANGGRLMKPWIVREVRDEVGTVIEEGSPRLAGTAISEDTARIVTSMMEAVVAPGGTGTRAAVPGFRVAGKTGTSQKVDPLTRGYSPDKRIASFGGFLPAEDPRLVILVVIDEPQGVKYGGVVAAPVFRRIAEEAVRYLGIPPSAGALPDEPVAARREDPAETEAGMVLPASLVPPPEGKTLVPDLTGLDLRGAVRVLSERHLEVRPVGTGVVTAQRPPVGTIIAPGDVVEVELAPRG